MATFLDIKLLIGRMLGIKNVNENDDFVIDLNNWRYSKYGSRFSSDDTQKQLVVSNAELKEVYDKVSATVCEGLELYSGSKYEVAIELAPFMLRQRDISIKHEDTMNALIYELGKPSIEYCFYLLILFLDTRSSLKSARRNPPLRFMRPMDSYVFRDESDNINITTISCNFDIPLLQEHSVSPNRSIGNS